ncbi:uncharacterized protein LOC143291367 [Babylonia areolata]|uniref:uncharacterized protein LOC143291367 n=1 Tax=Babylonia areolata TaxID=304850 RepID=UPI003FD59956
MADCPRNHKVWFSSWWGNEDYVSSSSSNNNNNSSNINNKNHLRFFFVVVVVIFVLLSECVVITHQKEKTGLSAKVFHNVDHVLEITCTGDVLDTSADLLTLNLYTKVKGEGGSGGGDNSRAKLASVNLRKNQCVSSHLFASCHVHDRDSLRTSLKVLVMDLGPGEERTFGCTAGYEEDSWLRSQSWTLVVRRNLCVQV